MLGVESTIADVAFGSAHSRCLRNVCFARDRIAVQRISLNNGDFDNAARHGIVVVKEKPSQPGATVITPAMTNLAIQTGSAAYCRTALQRPMAAVSADKSARRLIAGKMSGPGAADAVGGSGAFRRTVPTYFTPGIGLAEMPVGDRERRVDDNFSHLCLANDYFGPRAIERVGARRRGERCDSLTAKRPTAKTKPFTKTPLRFLFAGSTAAASDPFYTNFLSFRWLQVLR